MDWIEIHIPVNDEIKESVTNFLFEQNTTGCVDEKNKIVCYFRREDFTETLMSNLTLYLNELVSLGFPAVSEGISIKNLPDQEWNVTWRKNFTPIHATKRFVITPPWINYQAKADETVIIIDPKMAFGTGSHATTKLMIREMEKHLTGHRVVVDIGTGTGVLAIVASYLDAESIVGIDNDPVAIECAHESAAINNCSEKIFLLTGTIDDVKKSDYSFDTVLANIQQDVILKILNKISKILPANGLFIASGILITEMDDTIRAISKKNFKLIDQETEDEWCALVFKKLS